MGRFAVRWSWHPLALSLAIALFFAGPPSGKAQQVWRGTEAVTPQRAYGEWQRQHILYLGETHDSVADHAAQLLILQELQRRRPLAIALEMIQRPFQAALDAYIAGEITEMELLEHTQYAQRWGFPWSLYAPIFRFAKAQQIPLIALNTPTEVTRQVARQGLESLGEEDFRYIPPLADIDLSNTAYRDRLQEIFIAAHQGVSHSMNFDFFYQAQVLWDETMAKVVAQHHQQHPERLIVVLTGRGHVYFGDGIPRRVQRRLSPNLRQAIILLNPTATEKAKPGIADWFWQSDSP
ncbi:ChaN family lipoprotein [Thermosynechococcus sp.]|uniref:ChaN family lipoprotein n=1 Tax=Thermosynechococcus sp. TaxID=2814275 RepID=UPI00262622F4|nr:ChaN family lipoprotein [Thermosynechococcus sp.]